MTKSASLNVDIYRTPTGRVATEEREKSAVSESRDGGEEDVKVRPGKKIQTPESIQRRIDDLGKPPPARTKEFFVHLGLSGLGSNPHRLRAGKDVSREDLKVLLGEPTDRHQYKYDNCEDYDVRNWMESIWPLIYSKPRMNPNRLVSEQFAMGVYLDKRKKLPVNWASFAAETNGTQIRKYRTSIAQMTAERDKLMGAAGTGSCNFDSKLCPSPSAISVRHAPGVCTHPPPVFQPSSFSRAWTTKLVAEVEDRLRLVAMECCAAAKEVEGHLEEKARLSDQTRMKRMMMDSTQMTALLLENDVASAEALAATPAPTEDVHAPVDAGTSELPNPAIMLQESEFLQKKVRLQVYKELATEQEAAYISLSLQLELKGRAAQEALKKQEFLKSHHDKLGQQFRSLKKTGAASVLHPHPMMYESEAGDVPVSALKISSCVVCRYGFEFNDIVVASCRHLYHPWCGATHFKGSNVCADEECGQIMTPDWSKSFGFKEFDIEMVKLEETSLCEARRCGILESRKKKALLHCPSAGKEVSPPQVQLCTCVLCAEIAVPCILVHFP